MPVILGLGELGQEDYCEFKAHMSHRVSLSLKGSLKRKELRSGDVA